MLRNAAATIGLLVASASSQAQDAVAANQSTAPATAQMMRALKDYSPVLKSTLDRAWTIDARKGVETREVADNVYVVTDGVWQSAFVVTKDGVVVLDAPESYGSKIRAEIAAVTAQPIKTLVFTHIHRDHIGGSAAFADIKGLEIVALAGVTRFLSEKQDPNRLLPTRSFNDRLVLNRGGMQIELREAHYHSDEGDTIVYIPKARFLMAIDTLSPGYTPFQGFDITSNFHEYMQVFDTLLTYDFDVFVGGHLTSIGNRSDVEITRDFTRDVYETTKRIHREMDINAVFADAARQIGGYDNKFLLFKTFLDQVTAKAANEIEQRWKDRLAGADVFAGDHVRTALLYVRWDD